MNDLTRLSIADLSQALTSATLTPSMLIDAYLKKIERLNCLYNAYITVTVEQALACAKQADERQQRCSRLSPLDGIPIALKDNIDVAGVFTTNGQPLGLWQEKPAARDASAAALLREAGAVIIGKLNMHECALGVTSINPYFGPVRNPWDRSRTAGGSSGGAAAAVAARLCAGAIGSDTMGSVRLPAAYCGMVGFKPTYDRISTYGVVPLSPRFDHLGPIAHSVMDAALMLDVLCPGSSLDPLNDEAARGDAPADDLSAIRLGVITNFNEFKEGPLDDDIAAAFQAALTRFGVDGADVVRLAIPGYEPASARRAGLLLVEAEASLVHASLMQAHPDRYSPDIYKMILYGRQAEPQKLAEAEEIVAGVSAGWHRAFDTVDFIVSPTVFRPPFSIGAHVPDDLANYTAPANFAGLPAVSLPCGLTRQGLPIGLQLVAPRCQDRKLIRLAQRVERLLAFQPEPFLPE